MNYRHQLSKGFEELVYFFPVHRIVYNLKKNHALLAFWVLLWAMVDGRVGKGYGIQYLFLDPEYLHDVNIWSFFVVGMGLGGFIMAFHIAGYILDGYRYNFLGTLHAPLLHFCINNSLLPFVFILYYTFRISIFQIEYEHDIWYGVLFKILGFWVGIALMFVLSSIYFKITNRRTFRLLADSVDKTLKKGRLQRVNVMERLNKAKNEKIILHTYFELPWHFKNVDEDSAYDKGLILKVFDQTQLNAVLIQFLSLLSLTLLGIFRDIPFFQIPAAASVFLFLSVLVMLSGAIAYWLKEWALSVFIVVLILLKFVPEWGGERIYHQAFGMDYSKRVPYTLERLKDLSSISYLLKDKAEAEQVLEHWKYRVTEGDTAKKPPLIIVSCSGGGLRASVWTLRTFQYIDSVLQGNMMQHTMLITGSSGGAMGAAYFRELYYRKVQGLPVDPYDPKYISKIALDKLNPTVFAFVSGDLVFRFQTFKLGNKIHYKDRGYSLERQFLIDLDSVLDKPISAYRKPEIEAQIPMMIIAPSIVNDGRKLYISPLNISYMNVGTIPRVLKFSNTDSLDNPNQYKVRGIEFRRFFDTLEADSLRFMTALRMNATFPYVTPNVMLPSEPPMAIMDAGLADNFGIGDAVHFIHIFRDWIKQNTSGVILVSVRGLPREEAKEKDEMMQPISQWSAPISGLIGNLFDLQDIDNETEMAYIAAELGVPLHTVNFEYINALNKDIVERAAVSWRLTKREQKSIVEAITSEYNRASLKKLKYLLDRKQQ